MVSGNNIVGGLVGRIENNEGTHVTLTNCVNLGDVNSNGNTGGIVASLSSVDVFAVGNCANSGFIHVICDSCFVGGLIGDVNDQKSTANPKFSISSFVNQNSMNVTCNDSAVGGVIGRIHESANTNVALFNTTTSGSLHAAVKQVNSNPSVLGGLIGMITNNNNLTLTTDRSKNGFSIFSSGFNSVGGLLGSCSNSERHINGASLSFFDSVNTKALSCQGAFVVGGLVGYLFSVKSVTLERCENQETLNVTGTDISVGGLIGMFDNKLNIIISPQVTMFESANSGNINATSETTSNVGGLVGTIQDNLNIVVLIENSTNNANFIQSYGTNDTHTGGFVGSFAGNGNMKVSVSGCSNMAELYSSTKQISCIGGLIGELNENAQSEVTLSDVTNKGTIRPNGSNSCGGGLIGNVTANPVLALSISNGFNSGHVTSEQTKSLFSLGGIIGNVKSNPSITMAIVTCKNTGNVTSFVLPTSHNGGFIGSIDTENWRSGLSSLC